MDKQTKKELIFEIREAFAEIFEPANEKWVKQETLIENFQCFSKEWIKQYGSSLPRTRASVTDKNGETHRTSWVYPVHKINRMIADGSIKNLQIN